MTVTIDERWLPYLGAGIGLVVLVLLWWRWRARRRLVRRVALAALRMEEAPPPKDPRGLDRNLRRLERAIDRVMLHADDRGLAAARSLQALDAVPHGVVISDEHGTIVHRNKAAAPYAPGRLSDALVLDVIDTVLAEAQHGVTERRSLDLYGPPNRSLTLVGMPLDDGRRTAGAVAVIDDVTERRRLEAIRRDFVANISHELRTPVGALGVLAEAMLDEEDPAVSQRLANRILLEAERVGRTINDLLELSRIEGEETRSWDAVPVHLVVAEAVERSREAAEQRGIPIEVVEPARNVAIVGDRRQLVSALHNLVDNATKYSEPGSPIEVVARRVADTVEIQVRDHGIGIPARDLERIFERFYRVDRARSRETGGTGLGLAIVRHVVANHRGDCKVDSREGEGTTFTLTFPAAAVGPEDPPHSMENS